MSRKSPRFVPPGALVEITARTVGGRYLLRPSRELNEGVLAVLGRALALCEVDLHAVAFMSNHWHALVTVCDARALSRFVHHVHANVARLVNRLHGWDGSVFGKAAYVVVGESAEEERMRYVLAQGVKEGLVRRCTEWPGVHCARALLHREALVGRWRDRRQACRIRAGGGRGGGREPLRGEVETAYPIVFAPLPTWLRLSPGERLTRVRRMVDDIEEAASSRGGVLGTSRVCALDPLAKPPAPVRRRPPTFHTSDTGDRAWFQTEALAFSDCYHAARDALRRGRPGQLPARCFPPIAPFQPVSSTIWSTALAG